MTPEQRKPIDELIATMARVDEIDAGAERFRKTYGYESAAHMSVREDAVNRVGGATLDARDAIAAMRAENERMREALEIIANGEVVLPGGDPVTVARKALEARDA